MPTFRASSELLRLADTVLQPGFVGVTPPAWLQRRLSEGLGGVALFARNIVDRPQLGALTAALRQSNPDVVIAVDEEAGDVTRLEALTGSTRPGGYALGIIDDLELTEAVAEDLGWDLASAGINLNYAPDADVNTDVNNPVIGVRSFGEDPQLVARHTAAWIRGHQRSGVAACAKHFPGHGNTSSDSHLALPVIPASRDELELAELVPFRAAVAAGVRAVMTGHLLVPALDAELPATLSRRILTDLLRGELGFTGLAITDGIEMQAATARFGLAGASVMALAAGADAVCVGGEHADEQTAVMLRDAIVTAVLDGELPEQRLFEAAGRVAELAAWSRRHAGGEPRRIDQIGLAAARRATRVTVQSGAPRLPLTQAPHVVELSPASNIAVGDDVPFGLTGLLEEAFSDTTGVRLSEADADCADLGQLAFGPAAARPLVVVVRDAHRHQWISRTLRRLEESRGDCIVVETGIPAGTWGAVHVATYGGSLSCRRAAVELLTGKSK